MIKSHVLYRLSYGIAGGGLEGPPGWGAPY